ncbi:MAG: spore cortex biosynthesis protein YabQ [Bacilli bacterium]|jgi:hypothetical protein
MTIDIQLKSLLFSLLFGALFSLALRVNYKYIYRGNVILRILINLIFVIDNVLLYFIILKNINGGIIHIYFLLMILLGFVVMENILKRFSFTLKFSK